MGFFEGSFLRLVLVFKFSCFLLKYWALIRSGKGMVTVMALWNFLLLGSIVTIGLTAPPWTMISSTVSSSIGCTLMPTLTRLTSDLKLKRQRFSDWLLRLDENLKARVVKLSFLCSILFHSRSEILLLDFRILHLPECRVPHFIQHKNPEDPIRISFMRDAIRRNVTVFEKSGKSLIQWNYEYVFKIQ